MTTARCSSTCGERVMRDVHWHDRPFLPAGELITNNADGDTGKGLLAVQQAARFSRGEFGDRRMVVFAVAEDDFETVLKPRLVAADANLAYVRCVGWRRKGTDDALRIPDDIPVLEQHLSTMQVGLFVIDPLLSHLSAKTNSHIDHEVKLALRPLMQLAHNVGCAVLGNGHFGKDKASGARRASMGSTAFTNTPQGRAGDGLRRRGPGPAGRRGDQVEHRPEGRRPQLPVEDRRGGRADRAGADAGRRRGRRRRASTTLIAATRTGSGSRASWCGR